MRQAFRTMLFAYRGHVGDSIYSNYKPRDDQQSHTAYRNYAYDALLSMEEPEPGFLARPTILTVARPKK